MPGRRWLIPTFATLSILVLRAAGAQAVDPPRWVITVKQEKWTGLRGSVLHEGESVDLPELLWEVKSAKEPDGADVLPRPIVPFRNYLREVRQPLAKVELDDPVVIRIRGQKLEKTKKSFTPELVKSEYDGLYLACDLEGEKSQLALTKMPGQSARWRVVDAEQGQLKGRGEYQYVLEQKFRFRLEAVARPGWFLDVDEKRRICLSEGESHKHVIEVEVEKRYDDQSDGK